MSVYRVLVTGSREWDMPSVVHNSLQLVVHEAKDADCTSLLVVHGDCPSGADMHARAWAEDFLPADATMSVDHEPHPAIWRPMGIYDPLAGFARNQKMVDKGANVCLAFVIPCTKPNCNRPQPHDSHGTADCIRRAKQAGITVREIRR